ncbi:calcium-binding protein [Massilia pseudoviolaceinigra]|uniref:calcium-binding protein n=1 Tax=Massilia pseudoviolaceinigra TaxID=3057165 RepID=UPI0027968666|nr:calcium-binding protein [Massilia sp. CCM 9206]MDQ1924704.1 calcium-binding protein [Massilia sp. CCM 9206]
MTRFFPVAPSSSLDARRVSPASIPSATDAPVHIVGTEGDDQLYGTEEVDLIEGLGGDDAIEASGSNDTVLGGAGNDWLWGGTGNNLLDGGDGDDRVSAYKGGNTVLLGQGNDEVRLFETSGNNTIDGGEGYDKIYVVLSTAATAVTTVAHGGAADDRLDVSGADRNALANVVLYGDAGSDVFALEGKGSPRLSIADFDTGAGGDRVNVDYMIPSSVPQGVNPFGKVGILRLVQQGADTLLQRDADGAAGTAYGFETALVLAGVNAASLTRAHIDGNIDPHGLSVVTGTEGNDTLEGSSTDDQIYGLGGRDVVHGGYGNDYIEGGDETGAGDWIAGGLGKDTLKGGAGDDNLYGEREADLLDGGNGNDTLVGGEGNDTIDGGDGDDDLNDGSGGGDLDYDAGRNTVYGGAGNDLLRIDGRYGDLLDGGSGDDTLVGGNGSDTLDGGSGNDWFDMSTYNTYDFVSDTIVLGGDGDDTIAVAGGMSAENFLVTGGSGRDTIVFTDAADSYEKVIVTDFQAGPGGDLLDARFEQKENSNPFGSAGYLRLVQSGADTLYQFDGDGGAGTEYSFRTLATLKDVQASQIGAQNIIFGFNPDGSPTTMVQTGTSGNDKLAGSQIDDTIIGGAGQDTLEGNGGNDVMRGDDGNDAMNGGEGTDRLDGGTGHDTIVGGNGSDELFGGAGNDHLSDGGLQVDQNQVYGGDGDDVLEGRFGGGSYSGGNGNDTLTMTYGIQVADGGAGNDTLVATDGYNIQLNGGSGDDLLTYYGPGNSGLFGGSGRDVLNIVSDVYVTSSSVVAGGGAGDDTIKLVRNAAHIQVNATGGEGVDTYELSGAGRLGTLTIKDFMVGAGGDRFDVSDLFTAAMRATDPYEAGVLLLVKNGSSTVITLDRDGKAGPETGYVLATLENTTPASVKAHIVYTETPATSAAAIELVGLASVDMQLG